MWHGTTGAAAIPTVGRYGQPTVDEPVGHMAEPDRRGELLDLARRGDRDAFWNLVEPTLPRLYRTCLAQCGTAVDAEDLMQDALLSAWRRIATLRDVRAIGGWLAVIAVRHHVRAAKRSGRPSVSIDDLPDPPETVDPLGFIEWLAELPPQQADFLAAGFGDEEWWKRCNAYFICGGPNGIETGSEGYAKPNLDKARELLKESGYKGEKLVLSTSNDIAPIGRMAEVAAASLKKVGFNVDVQFADWGAVTTRQQNKSTPDQGGWNLFVTYASGATMQSPLTNIGTNMACERAWAGWPCDAEAE
ncbi:MAG: hypothetical protein EPO57_10390, partial [Chitinophagaceae bacterium]